MTSQAEYVENEVLSREGVELVCMLYAKALERISDAERDLEAERIKERAAAIGDAMAIVVELQGSLDFEKGGDIASRLAELYGYIQQKLLEANADQSLDSLCEARSLLNTLYEGWNEAREGQEPATGAPRPTPRRASREWTL